MPFHLVELDLAMELVFPIVKAAFITLFDPSCTEKCSTELVRRVSRLYDTPISKNYSSFPNIFECERVKSRTDLEVVVA